MIKITKLALNRPVQVNQAVRANQIGTIWTRTWSWRLGTPRGMASQLGYVAWVGFGIGSWVRASKRVKRWVWAIPWVGLKFSSALGLGFDLLGLGSQDWLLSCLHFGMDRKGCRVKLQLCTGMTSCHFLRAFSKTHEAAPFRPETMSFDVGLGLGNPILLGRRCFQKRCCNAPLR